MGFDDKKASWEISLFLIAAAAIIIAVGAFTRTASESVFKNPALQIVFAALFVSILYWLIRHFKVSRKKSLLIAAIIIITILFVSISGIRFFVVMSNSMKQSGAKSSLYGFWETLGYSAENFGDFPFSGGFQAGDLIIVKRTSDLKVGDVAVDTSRSTPVIHRIFFINDTLVMTAGDGLPPKNATRILNSERRPREHIYGKIEFIIPKGGIIKALYNCYLDGKCSYTNCFKGGRCG
ncbi:MAG: hypothetical protein V1839_03140 [archaeon]